MQHNTDEREPMKDTIKPMDRVNRVEVISENGREYVNMDCQQVQIAMQDDGRTIKIFLIGAQSDEDK